MAATIIPIPTEAPIIILDRAQPLTPLPMEPLTPAPAPAPAAAKANLLENKLMGRSAFNRARRGFHFRHTLSEKSL
jgi:hypothetical protein